VPATTEAEVPPATIDPAVEETGDMDKGAVARAIGSEAGTSAARRSGV
jgi:hypothetical protein